jgi:LAGLIDADG endonuclease
MRVKKMNKKNIKKKMKKLDFWYITGLADAESSFVVNIIKDDTRSTGYNTHGSFELNLNYKDKRLLENIKYTLGVGNIFYNSNDKTYKFKVSNINELSDVIIPHFKKYYLITQKRVDYELFSKIIEIIKNREYLTKEGLQKIVNLKTTLNLGISDSLMEDFPETIINKRDVYNNINIPDSNWLAGFSEGESCFYISIYKSERSRLGFAVQLVFKITQHSRDIELLKSISNYLGCGRVEKRRSEACDFTVTSLKSFDEKIIPFFLENPLYGSWPTAKRILKRHFLLWKIKNI